MGLSIGMQDKISGILMSSGACRGLGLGVSANECLYVVESRD